MSVKEKPKTEKENQMLRDIELLKAYNEQTKIQNDLLLKQIESLEKRDRLLTIFSQRGITSAQATEVLNMPTAGLPTKDIPEGWSEETFGALVDIEQRGNVPLFSGGIEHPIGSYDTLRSINKQIENQNIEMALTKEINDPIKQLYPLNDIEGIYNEKNDLVSNDEAYRRKLLEVATPVTTSDDATGISIEKMANDIPTIQKNLEKTIGTGKEDEKGTLSTLAKNLSGTDLIMGIGMVNGMLDKVVDSTMVVNPVDVFKDVATSQIKAQTAEAVSKSIELLLEKLSDPNVQSAITNIASMASDGIVTFTEMFSDLISVIAWGTNVFKEFYDGFNDFFYGVQNWNIRDKLHSFSNFGSMGSTGR